MPSERQKPSGRARRKFKGLSSRGEASPQWACDGLGQGKDSTRELKDGQGKLSTPPCKQKGSRRKDGSSGTTQAGSGYSGPESKATTQHHVLRSDPSVVMRQSLHRPDRVGDLFCQQTSPERRSTRTSADKEKPHQWKLARV